MLPMRRWNRLGLYFKPFTMKLFFAIKSVPQRKTLR